MMWIHNVEFHHVHIYTLDEFWSYPVSCPISNRPTQCISKPHRYNRETLGVILSSDLEYCEPKIHIIYTLNLCMRSVISLLIKLFDRS